MEMHSFFGKVDPLIFDVVSESQTISTAGLETIKS
jgi:hypothetical protein